MNQSNREQIEADAFDNSIKEAYDNLQDGDLILPDENINQHLNLQAPPKRAYAYAFFLLKDKDISGQQVLNVACGTGHESIILAKKGAEVFSFDISPMSIKIAQKRARLHNLQDKIHAEVMSVYEMQYPDNHFNFVYGEACLHHFDLEAAMREVQRVLKPNGVAVFHEPFGASKTLQKIRDWVPVKKDIVSPDERQLTYEDITVIQNIFNSVTLKEFGLFSRLKRLTNNRGAHRMMHNFDDLILEKFPKIKKYAASVVILAKK